MVLEVKSWTLGPFATNCYLVIAQPTKEAILFDASFESEKIVRDIKALGVKLKALINTHGHIDHVAGNRTIVDAFSVPLMIHQADVALLERVELQGQFFGVAAQNSPPATQTLDENDVLELAGYRFNIFHTPGHCPGSLSFYQKEHQFCIVGDTLFAGSVGRVDLPGGDWPVLERSIREKLYTLPDETIIYPGHMGSSTIGREKRTNPFVNLR